MEERDATAEDLERLLPWLVISLPVGPRPSTPFSETPCCEPNEESAAPAEEQ